MKPILVAVALVALVACSTPAQNLHDGIVAATTEEGPVLTVVWAGKPVTLKDEDKKASITVQMVRLNDGSSKYSTGCILHKGEEVKPPCRTANTPTGFDWVADSQ